MTIKDLYEEMAQVHCEDYEVTISGNFCKDDIGGVEYFIDDDNRRVHFGDVEESVW